MSALMSNWDIAESALQSSINSQGSAERELSNYQKGIEYSVGKFKAQFQDFSNTVLDSSVLKTGVDIGTGLLSVVTGAISTIGLPGLIAGGIGGKSFFKNLDQLSDIGTVKKAGNDFNELSRSLKNIGDSERAADALRKVGDSIPDNTKVGAMVNAFSSLDSDFDSSKAKDLLGIADATDDIIGSVNNLSGSTGIIDKFKSGITGLATTAKNFVVTNPIATGIMATTAVLGAGYIAYKKYKSNMIKEADSATTDWNGTYSDLQDKMSQYKELKIKLDSGGLSDAETLSIKQQILDIQSQITSAYGEQASGINMVNGSLENQLSVIQKIESKQASQNLNENRKAYEDAKREMTKDDRSYMLGDVAQSIDAGGVAKDIYDIANDIEGITPDKNETGAFTIHFNGDVTQANEAINSFMTRVGDLREKYKTDKYATDIIDNVLGYSQTSLEDVSDILGKYQENYKSFLQQSMFAEGTGKGKPATILNDYAQAVDDYNRALASGNSQEIVSARDNYNSVKDNVDGLLKNKPQYESLFDDVSNQLDESSRKAFDFSEAMQGSVNKDNVFSKSAKDINKLSKSLNKLDLDTSDIVNALTTSGEQTGESAIRKLANIWGLTTDASQEEIEDFAYTLSNMGLVSNGSSDSIKNIASSYDELTTSLQNAITNQEAVNTAVQNSVSATGLTSDDITNLSNIYGEYEGFESIFERSANGVQLNRDALNALEQQQESLIKQDFAESIREQQKAYEDAQKAYKDAKKDSTVSDADREALKVSMDDAKTQLENIKMLSSVYDGLTSSYNKWMSASSDTEEGARFDNVMSKFQSAQSLREQGLIGTEEFRGAVDYFWSGDASLLNAQELKKTYDELNPLISDWYQLNEDGSANNDASIKAFRDDAKQLSDILGKPVNTSFEELEDGTRKATLNAKEFADAWGVSEDVVQDVAGKMRDYGWDVEVTGVTDSSENIKELAKNAEEAQSKLKRLTGETYEWDFNTTDAQKATEQVQKATEQLQQFKKSTGEYDYSQSGATEAAQVYEAVVRQEQVATKPAISNVDTSSVVESSQNWVTAAQNFQTAKDELDVQTQLANQGLQNDVENATKTANEALNNLQEVSKNGSPFDIDTSGIQEAENSLAGISEKDLQMKVGADTSDAESSVEGIANEEVEVPVTVQLEEGQFSTLMEGITGEEYEATVTVNEEKGTEVTNEQPEAKTQVVNEEKGTEVTNEQPEPVTQEVDREVNDSETSKEPAPVTQEVNQKLNKTIELGVGDSQQGGVITYQSKVEPPEVPDVKGGTVVYKSKVQKPAVPDVEGKTVTYKVNVESASVPTLEGTVNYKGNFPTSAPVLDGTVNYSASFSGEVSAASGTANFTLGNSPKEVPPAQGIANFSLGSSPTTVPPASGVANFSLGSYPTSLPAATQVVHRVFVGGASVNGTAHALGTAFANGTIPKLSSRALAMGSLEEDATHRHEMKALASGDWRTKKSETALVGELGREIVVLPGGNRWVTVGDNGAEFAHIPAGSIVFNHLQTEEIFRNGYVTSGGGRGRIMGGSARLSGSAHVQGTAYASGTKSKWENAMDWIERLISKLEHNIDLYGLKSENATIWTKQNKYIATQEKNNAKLIKANEKGAKQYRKEASSVGLSKDLQKKVLNGTIDVQTLSEENKQKVEDYQQMIDKAREAEKAVEELKKQQKELAQTKLDNLVAYYDSINNKLEAQQSIYSAKQKYWQESGHGGNTQEKKMINDQMKLQRLITKNLDKEAKNYAKQMKAAKKKFGANSNQYRDVQAKYYEIKAAKIESETSLENLKNQRREIAYNAKQYIIDGFERLGDRLSASEKYYTASNASVDTRIGNYKQQIDNYNDQIYAKRQLQKLYVQRMAQLHEGDLEYQETAEKVAKLDTEIINLATDIENAKDSIRKARWEAFNENMTSVNNAITENDEIRKMLNQNGMVNREDGTLNADGYANILLIGKGIELNNQKIADYKVALNKVKEELDHGVISQSEYNEYVNQYQSEIRKAASANKDYSDSLISMYKDQIKYENEALQDNIKKRKEALSAKEDYYQYDRKINKQTKDINSLKAQIAALEGATNAADKARKRLLEEQLSQKQDDLNDDVHSHRVDLITSGYDKLSQSASEAMNDTLDELETNTEAQKQCVDNMLAYLERGFIKTGDSISSTMGDVSKSITSGFDVALGRVGSLLEDTAIKVSDIFDKIIKVQNINTNPNNATASDSANNVDTSGISGLDKTESDIVDKVTNGGTGEPEIVHVQSVSCASSIVITEGESYKLKCTVSPSNATTKGLEAKSANESYVTVSPESSNGYITIKGIKTVGSGSPITVTITSKDVKKAKTTCKVRVRTKTASTLADKAGKGDDNEGKSLVNQVLKKYNYDNFTKAQQLQFAKDYGVKADEKTIFTDAVQKQLAEKMDAHLKKVTKNKIESFINGLPKEDRDAAYVEKNGGIIGKYISQKHNKRISPAQAVELGNILGMGYSSDLTKWSSAQKNALVSKLKNYGFSSGGIVKKGRYLPVDGFAEIMKKAAINNGDDGWISVKRGEEILNNDQVKEQIKLANHVMAQSKMYEMQTKMLEGIINNSSNISENNNNVIYYDSFLKVEGNITEDVLPKVESMIKQNIEAVQSSAFKDISKQFSKEFDKLGMRRRR